MRGFIHYYKWHLIFLTLIIICCAFVFTNMTTITEPDVTIGFAGLNYVNVQTFNDKKTEIEKILADTNNDDKKMAQMASYTLDLQSDLDETLIEMMDSGDYDIYISNKDAFKNFEDKSKFVTVNEYIVDAENEKYDVIKDKSGRIYAISLLDNEYVEKLGIMDTKDLYIAVAAPDSKDSDEVIASRKNGKNIALFIFKEGIV